MNSWFKKWGKSTATPTSPPPAPEPITEANNQKTAPHITVECIGLPDGRIEIQCDWNSEFVEYLRDNGFNGTTEESVVQQYIAVMHRQLLSEEGQTFE